METVRELTRFYNLMVDDARLGHAHICMYMALFQLWNLRGFQNPVTIKRQALMRAAKINSNATYAKCLKELAAYGYIRYCKSNHPGLASRVMLLV